MDNIIKAEDYQGTTIYDTLVSSGKNEEIIRETIANNLRKGLITQDQFNKANAQLDDLIKAGKKTGAGSRGGHVIGYTKSGKPVYKGKDQAHAKEYKKFSAQDHADAAELHRKETGKHFDNAGKVGYIQRQYFIALADHHQTASQSHEQAAHKQAQKEHESGLSADEKKIIAAQKKKQMEHHDKMYGFHEAMLKHATEHGRSTNTTIPGDFLQHHAQQAHHHKLEKERLEKE